MIEASSSIELEEFEQIEAAPGMALLRVAARPSAGDAAKGTSTLVVDDGARRHRLPPLPAPPDPAGLLRAAYSAPLELLEGQTAFALELPDGSVIDLPAPTHRRKRLARSAPSETQGMPSPTSRAREVGDAKLLSERTLRDEAERRAESRLLAIDELERRLQAEQDRRAGAEAQMASAAAERAEAITRSAVLDLEQRAAIAEREAAIQDVQERLMAVGRALAEERARAAAELEQARAAAAQADRHALEQERGRAEAEEHAGFTEALAAESERRLREMQAALADAVERTGMAVARSATLEQQMHDDGATTTALEATLAAATAEATRHRQRAAETERLRAEAQQRQQEAIARAGSLQRELAAANAAALESEAALRVAEGRVTRMIELEATALAATQAAGLLQTEHQQMVANAQAGAPAVEADLEEARTRASTLEQVVRTESGRRAELESTRAELQEQVAALAAERSSLSERLGRALEAEAGAAESARANAQLEVQAAREAEQRSAAEVARVHGELEETREALRRARAQAQRMPVSDPNLDAVRLAAETRAREQAQAEVEAAMRAHTAEREPAQRAARERDEAERLAARWRPAKQPRRLPSLPSEVVLGLCLLALGLIVAVLFLTGEVKLGFAP